VDAQKSSGASGCLLRLFWMLFGHLLLAVLGGLIAIEKELSLFDAAYWATVLGLIGARYLDIVRFGGSTAEGNPATMLHFRRFTGYLLGLASVAWLAAHGWALARDRRDASMGDSARAVMSGPASGKRTPLEPRQRRRDMSSPAWQEDALTCHLGERELGSDQCWQSIGGERRMEARGTLEIVRDRGTRGGRFHGHVADGPRVSIEALARSTL
jgi:hypothetical protein